MGNRQGKEKGKLDLSQLSRETLFPTKKLDEWFRFFNSRFPDGKVTREEFEAIYRQKWNCEGDASDLCDHVFRHYDRDGDGSVDFRELMTALSANVRGTVVEQLQWTFKLYDVNGNGFLDRGEVIAVLTALYKSRSQENPAEKAKETTERIFANADDDGDGNISEEEFVKHAVAADASITELLQGY